MIRPVTADGRIDTGGAFTPIHRPRVVERIESAATQRVVLVVAPAGYGKSVALTQFLQTLEVPHVRYDVHEENGNLLGFIRGFADVLLEIAPDARKTVSGAFEKSDSSKTPGLDLAMWMHAHIKTFTGVIAIDDLHIAENDPEITKFLVSLIDRTKGRVRWIMASRSSLDLPVGSWLAYGDMDLSVDEQDLRFDLDEARETARASRVSVRDDELREILEMTEGWPTALGFAVRSSTRSVDLRNIAASTREMVYRYLAEQVYQALDADERELLHFVGYLPEIDLEVLRQAGYTRAKAIVERLRDRVAFIYPDRPNVYRCHDLFRDFLQHQVELDGDTAVDDVRYRVASALEKAGIVHTALSVYASIPSETNVLRILEEHGFALMQRAHGDIVTSALDAVSPEMRATNAVVLGLRAMREADRGRYERAESLFRRAMQKTTDVELRSDLAARLGVVLLGQGQNIIGLLEPLLEDDLSDPARAKVLSLLTPAYAYASITDKAHSAFMEAEGYATTIESDELRARLLHRMGMAALALSMPQERVLSLFGRAHALANENALYFTSAAALGGLATASLFYEDDATRYVWYAQQAMNAAAKAGDHFSMQTAMLQVITAEARRGNVDRLSALEHQFAAVSGSDSALLFYMVPVRAMMAAWQGRLDEAYRQMSTVTNRNFYNFDRVFNGALHALYAVASGLHERAIELSSAALSEIQASPFEYLHGRRLAELSRLLCAICDALTGRVSVAQRALNRRPIEDAPYIMAARETALAICRFVKNPALYDEAVEGLEQLQAMGYGGVSRVLKEVLTACSREQVGNESLLTKAELDVLACLGRGLSPKDIAHESGRSVYTIQAHIQNAIRKLGCSGRNEALSVARRRGLMG